MPRLSRWGAGGGVSGIPKLPKEASTEAPHFSGSQREGKQLLSRVLPPVAWRWY